MSSHHGSAAHLAHPPSARIASAGPDPVALAAAAFEASPVATALIGPDGTVLRANQRWRNLAGQLTKGGGQPAPGANQFETYRAAADEGDEGARLALAGMEAVAAGRCACHEQDYRASGAGAVRWFQLEVAPAPPHGIVVSHRDITNRVESEAAAHHRAAHDPLTGLLNRARAIDLLDDRLPAGPAQPVTTVFYVDLDGFKAVNDRYGHHVGDRLLHIAARRLEGAVRAGDEVARLGGDEFVVVSVGCAPAEIAGIANRACEVLRAPITVADRRIALTASVGVAVAGLEHERTSSLLRDADIAMYAAKAAGGNRWRCFAPGMGMPHEADERVQSTPGCSPIA